MRVVLLRNAIIEMSPVTCHLSRGSVELLLYPSQDTEVTGQLPHIRLFIRTLVMCDSDATKDPIFPFEKTHIMHDGRAVADQLAGRYTTLLKGSMGLVLYNSLSSARFTSF